MRLLTNDLYEGAWLLSQGMELSDLWLDRSGKKVVVFEFTGEDILALQNRYREGRAEVNVVKLKSSLREMKDRMFWLLKTKELQQTQRSRQGGQYAGATQSTIQSHGDYTSL